MKQQVSERSPLKTLGGVPPRRSSRIAWRNSLICRSAASSSPVNILSFPLSGGGAPCLRKAIFVLLQASYEGPVCGTSGCYLADLLRLRHSRHSNGVIAAKPESLVELQMYQEWFMLRQVGEDLVVRGWVLRFGVSMLVIHLGSYLMKHDGQVRVHLVPLGSLCEPLLLRCMLW